jgi:hypothetical protein
LIATQVDKFNVTMLVSNEFGRSLTSANQFLVSSDEVLYNFQTYAQTSSVSSNSGSVNGGNQLTLNGLFYYNDAANPAQVLIGGTTNFQFNHVCNKFKLMIVYIISKENTPCVFQSYSGGGSGGSSVINCIAGAQPSQSSSDYIGGLGVSLYVLNQVVALSNQPAGLIAQNAVKSVVTSMSYSGNASSTICLEGYINPQRTSLYEFSLITNADAKSFYISSDQTAANQVQFNVIKYLI